MAARSPGTPTVKESKETDASVEEPFLEHLSLSVAILVQVLGASRPTTFVLGASRPTTFVLGASRPTAFRVRRLAPHSLFADHVDRCGARRQDLRLGADN